MIKMDHLPQPEVYGGCIYYAQNREDLILQAFFPDIEKGFYVDIGAYDPDYDSVTKLFYKKGWNGINVEPQARRHKLFEKRRKRDINLNIGVSDKPGTLTLRTYANEGWATFSADMKQEYERKPDLQTVSYTEAAVEVKTLKQIFSEHKVETVQFLKIDVEGLEYEVLQGNDWKRNRPEVLCIEADHIKHDWHELLKEAGYKIAFFDGLNEYFVDTKTDREKKFNYIQSVVIERGGGLRADHYEALLAWREVALHKTNHVQELVGELEALRKDNEALIAEKNSIRSSAHNLGNLAKRNIKAKIKH